MVGPAQLDQALRVLLVHRQALGLTVWGVGTAAVGALVPFDPEPVQGVVDLLLTGFDVAAAVGVLDAQKVLAAVVAGEGRVKQGAVGGADVRIPRRRRRGPR